MLKIFTLKFEERTESFNDTVLADFLSGKKLIKWNNRFFENNSGFFWTVILEYEPVFTPLEKVSKKGVKKKEDYKELLKESDWPLFNRLREWRGELCKADGIPPYIILTNKQLATIAVKRPGSLNSLQEVEGVGEVKREKYGKEIIGIVKAFEHPAESRETGQKDG